ncbi:MAG TPA: hypothetical protein VNM48_00495 [Chloroflexota bacterium]|nr:hypothetical protein [Chloroflexota bacterium]
MANLSDYLEAQLLNHVFRTATYTKPVTVYVALYTAAPTDAGGGTEVTGGAYARQAITSVDASWAAPGVAGLIDNLAAINFPVASAAWGVITHAALLDAITVGNFLFHGALGASKTIGVGDQFIIPIGQLDLTLS